MPWYMRNQQEDDSDDDQQSNQQNQQQDDEDDDDNKNAPTRGVGSQQNDDEDDDDDNQKYQTQQQQQGDEDDDDNDNANARGVKGNDNDDDDDDDNNAGWRGQSQDDKQDNDDDDEDAGNTQRGRELQQDDDDEDDQGGTKAQDDDEDDDEQKAPKSSDVNINFNINLAGNLKDSELHEGGVIFSKKLLAQLFSGPGEHDPDEKELPVHQIQHDHVETAASGEWTVVELKTQDAKGVTVYIKAKLDSGADDSFMSFDTYEVTGLGLTPYEGPEGPPSYTMGGGQESQPLGTVRLEYTAGIKPQKFIETFQVLEGLPHDVIIGKPLMTRAHMMMVNPNFANPPNHPALCLITLAPKDKDSKAKAEAFQRQRAAEQAAAYQAKIKAQGAPKSGKKPLFKHLFK